jgi:hypothetical protein
VPAKIQAGVILAVWGIKSPYKNKKPAIFLLESRKIPLTQYKLNKMCKADESADPKMGKAQKSITK